MHCEVNAKRYDVSIVCVASGRPSITGASGCRTKFPSLGGVERVMNSIVVGSLSAACRKAVKEGKFCKREMAGMTCLPVPTPLLSVYLQSQI
jgi:hypothetical protein